MFIPSKINIIKINGIYDIICSLSILFYKKKSNIFNKIHINMIKKPNNEYNYLAYWIFTNGFMRLYSNELAFYSYIFESLFYFNELYNKNVYKDKALFTIILSLYLAINIKI